MTHTAIDISIIIVNYNGKHFLAPCLDSVLPETDPSVEIIVVDNASWDGSAEFLTEQYPQVRLIRSDRNLGFAGGNNLGVRESHGRFIVLLNNDTTVHAGWLTGLRAVMDDVTVGSASSLIRTEGIPDRYYEKNGSVNLIGHNIMRIFDVPEDIFYAGGASMIFRKETFGLPFDDDYFVYSEDVYLGLRTRFMGLQVRHTNLSRVDHVGSGTAKKEQSAFLAYFQERNRLLNTLLFFSVPTIIKTIPFLLMNATAKLTMTLLTGKSAFHGILKAYLWIAAHPSVIRTKRFELQKERRVNDEAVLRSVTGKLTNGENGIGRFINAVAILYCRIVRLKVREVQL